MWLKLYFRCDHITKVHFYKRSYHSFNFMGTWPEKHFLEGWSCLKVDNLETVLAMALIQHFGKRVKIKLQKVTREKLVRGFHPNILDRVNSRVN